MDVPLETQLDGLVLLNQVRSECDWPNCGLDGYVEALERALIDRTGRERG